MIIAGDFNAQLGLDDDSECDHVEKHAMGEPNERGICMLIVQNCVALKTAFKKKDTKSKHPSSASK